MPTSAVLSASLALACSAPAQPAGAEVKLVEAYGDLIAVRPAALVATTLPTALGPLGALELTADPKARGRYALTFNHVNYNASPGHEIVADLVVEGLGSTSLAAERRKVRRVFRESSTRVRGHLGLLLRARHGSAVALLWSEGGRLHVLGTETPKVVSVADLQATAGGLAHLLGDLKGWAVASVAEPFGAGAEVIVTDRAVVFVVRWTAAYNEPGSTSLPLQGGSEATFSLPLSGGAFSLAPVQLSSEFQTQEGEGPTWTLSLSGNATPTGGTMTVQAVDEGPLLLCTAGPIAVPLAVNPQP